MSGSNTKISRKQFLKLIFYGTFLIFLGIKIGQFLSISPSSAIPKNPIMPTEEEEVIPGTPSRIEKYYPIKLKAGDRVFVRGKGFIRGDKILLDDIEINAKVPNSEILYFNLPLDTKPGPKIVKIKQTETGILSENSVTLVILETFRMVVFGDSIAWGQGLREEEKFSSLVANDIERLLGNRVAVDKKVYAHSGAVIGYHLSQADLKERNKYGDGPVGGDRIAYGEVPTTWPTIDQQIDNFVNEYGRQDSRNIENTDLILLVGGINDVGVMSSLIGPSLLNPFYDREKLRRKTESACYEDMKLLLEKVVRIFGNAKTKIVVAGYFKIVSEESDLAGIMLLVGVVGAAAGSFIQLPALGAADAFVYKNNLVENSRIFEEISSTALSRAVREINNTSAGNHRVFFAHPNFRPSNSMFAPNRYLYNLKPLGFIDDFLHGPVHGSSLAEDSIKGYREQRCKEVGDRAPFNCGVASAGHPNPAGAQAYRYAIMTSGYSPLPPRPNSPCLPLVNDLNGLKSKLMRLQEENKTPGRKGSLIEEIEELRTQIIEKEKQYKECIAQNPL